MVWGPHVQIMHSPERGWMTPLGVCVCVWCVCLVCVSFCVYSACRLSGRGNQMLAPACMYRVPVRNMRLAKITTTILDPTQDTRLCCPTFACTTPSYHPQPSFMLPAMPLLPRGRPLARVLAQQQPSLVRTMQQTSLSDPPDGRPPQPRDGKSQRAPPSSKSAQELEPSLGSSNLLRSTPEEVRGM